MKIGLFFGSFNPIHVGHLILANGVLENSDLDSIWFVISPQNPLKEKSSLLSEHNRYTLVDLAIKNNEKFKVCDIEFRLEKPSYTINTLNHLTEKYPNHEFSIIMGQDNIETIHKWKNYEAILKYYHIWVYPRINSKETSKIENTNVKYLDLPLLNISSSYIRKLIKENKSIQYLVNEEVYKFLESSNWYK